MLAFQTKILFLASRGDYRADHAGSQGQSSQAARSAPDINTYHGFAWSFIQTNGYLLTGDRKLRLLPPPEAAGKPAGIRLMLVRSN